MIVVGILLALIAVWAVTMGALTWNDARRLTDDARELARLILIGIIDPLRYWYFERPRRWPRDQQREWLEGIARRMELTTIRAARCPLCGAELLDAWAVDDRGQLTVARTPVECPRCDFRLDACRHCAFFQPAGGTSGIGSSGMEVEWTHGRCTHYKSMQPVEEITTPDMARRMKERGYHALRAPTPIIDSYVPLPECTAFRLEPRRLRHSGMLTPPRRQRLALRVLEMIAPAQGQATGEEPSEPSLDDEAQWLL
ncbi:MAG: hypothetical protein Kow0047_16550 [Anaerolineae bacterium]